MQYRLSTLFLIFFMVAASLAVLVPEGLWHLALWIDTLSALAAFCLNRSKKLEIGIVSVCLIVLCLILSLPLFNSTGNLTKRAQCINNLKQIGMALHNYRDANIRYPRAYITRGYSGALYSWRVQVLPVLGEGYGVLYDSLKRDEPWNSPYNIIILSQRPIPGFKCPSNAFNDKDFSTNYLAIIGPGTLWKDEFKAPRAGDLPDGGSHTVAVIEVANSDVHWAEPRDLTVEEALEGLRTGKGLRISSPHRGVINVLFADGSVRSLPSKMPISLWKKLLAGEVKDVDNMSQYIDESAPDMVDVSIAPPATGQWRIVLASILWLLSIALLFRRAIKSRPKPAEIEIAQDAVG